MQGFFDGGGGTMVVLTKVRIREPAVPSENPCLEADAGMEYAGLIYGYERELRATSSLYNYVYALVRLFTLSPPYVVLCSEINNRFPFFSFE